MSDPVAEYLSLGWAITPLHGVDSTGRCRCGNPDPEHSRGHGGKHPIFANWQINPIRDAATSRAVFTAHPGSNVGILTGRASGIWVLDVDPDNGGHVALAELVARHGALPTTRQHSTGSGGAHLIWSLPSGWVPTNRRGSLPRGLDVRGDGGQIVAPPSRSAKGGYSVVVAGPALPAPGWLLEMIKPPEYEPRVTPAVTLGNDGSRDVTRGLAYASQTMASVCAELANAPAGTRNDAAFRASCRLWELVNAGWVPPDSAHARYIEACALADDQSAPFPPSEAESVWQKAWRRVAGVPATLPPDSYGEIVPFADALASRTGGAGASLGSVFVDPGGPAPAPAASNPGDNPQVTVQSSLPGSSLLARMLSGVSMRDRPRPKALIEGLLYLDSLAWMIGKSGSYKSFVALDMASCVACDTRWQGRRVRSGTVVYVCAEGQGGMSLRVDAWMRTRRRADTGGLLILPEAVQVADTQAWQELIDACVLAGPVLVVIDTQARCTVGLEENSAKEMGLLVASIDRLRAATGACVLVIHHIGRNGADARGSSAIDGAQDTELKVSRGAPQIGDSMNTRRAVLATDKQKDGDDSISIELAMRIVDLGIDPTTGQAISSLAVEPESAFTDPAESASTIGITRMHALVGVLLDVFGVGEGGSREEIRTQFMARVFAGDDQTPQATRRRAWQLAWGGLIERRRIMRRCGMQRFRFIPLAAYGDLDNGPTEPKLPDGWELWLKDRKKTDGDE